MESPSSFEFVESIRRACDVLARLVWASHKLGLERDGEWPEAEFFSALINQGFGQLDPRAKKAFEHLEASGAYRLTVKCARHSAQAMEPITGADLGVVATITINGREFSRRGFLVQLKKASVRAGKVSTASVGDLHHLSGERMWKRKLHQAERMLKFTNAAAYWIAVPPGAEVDQAFFKLYLDSASLAARRRFPETAGHDAGVSQAALLGAWLPLWLHHPDIDFILHRLEGWMGVPPAQLAAYLADSEADRLYRSLRRDAAGASRRQYGLRSFVPVMAVDAESVLGLYQAGQRNGLVDLYPSCVTLSDFLLTDVIAHGFGDEDAEFIEAILKNRPNSYIRGVVADFLEEEPPETIPVAKATMTVAVTVTTGPPQG